MCVILSSGPGVMPPPVEHLVAANDGNPHGWGVAINLPKACRRHKLDGPDGACPLCRNASHIEIKRGFETEELISAVCELNAKRNHLSSLVVHCRIATGGTVTIDNTHPFEVTPKLMLFHNGMFPESVILTVSDPKKPDSYHLAKLLIPALAPNPRWALSPAFSTWLDTLCETGYPNKVSLLDAVYGNILYNADAWVDGLEGRIYSNDGPLWDAYDKQLDLGEEEKWEQEFMRDYMDDTTYSEYNTWKDDRRILERLRA